ncbi:MAG: SCO family protein [Gammaproteobacteria bacterium]
MSSGQQKSKSRRVVLYIVVLCAAPIVIALVLYGNRSWLVRSSHYGALIVPAIPVGQSEFIGFDPFSVDNIGEIKGRWVLIHFITGHGCGSVCHEALEKTRRVRLMLSKDLMRVRRLAVVMTEISEPRARIWWAGHPYLLRAKSNSTLEKIAASVMGSPIPDGSVMLMDPLGNLMMWYPNGFDPYGLKKDLQRLLNVSQIG